MLMANMAVKNSFQFIPLLALIPVILYMNFSNGFIKSVKVFSPANILAMYFPSGYASSIVSRKVTITPVNSVFMIVCFKIFQV